MRTLLAACCCLIPSLASAAPIDLCSGLLCLSFDESDAYAPTILNYGEASISGPGSADGFVARMQVDGVSTNLGASHGGDFPKWERYEPDALFARLTKLAPTDGAAAIWLAQGIRPSEGGFEVKQFVNPGRLGGEIDQVYGFLMNFDAGFTDWRAYNSAGALVQKITADASLAQQRLGGSQDVRTIVAYDYDRGFQLIVENTFEPYLDPFWFLVAEGKGRTAGHKLYGRLDAAVGSEEFYRADWTIRVAPFTAAVPEPAGAALLAGLFALVLSLRRVR